METIRLLYNLAFPFVLLAMLPGFIFKMLRRGNYKHKFGQRFGIYSSRVKSKVRSGSLWIWVHAVSVGEVLIALKLIDAMRETDPWMHVVLSTTTSTGFGVALKSRSKWLEPIYAPIDFVWTTRRAVRLFKPRQLILIEAEVWPNLTAEARAQGATLSLVNARLSPRSEARFRAVKWFVRPVFRQLDLICVQETRDIERWKELGVSPDRILLTGSIKFDDEEDSKREKRDFRTVLQKLGVPDDAPVLLGGSTFHGEEAILASIYQEIRKDFPGLFLVLVPRHFERAPEIAAQLGNMGLKPAFRTRADSTTEKPDLLIVDTTGELRDWYACATVVFVGKSLTARGGQNPAEAVAAGKPVIFGPNMQNFSSLSRQLLKAKGAVQVAAGDGLQRTIRKLLADPAECSAMALRGAQCLQVHRGATRRTVEALRKVFAERWRRRR